MKNIILLSLLCICGFFIFIMTKNDNEIERSSTSQASQIEKSPKTTQSTSDASIEDQSVTSHKKSSVIKELDEKDNKGNNNNKKIVIVDRKEFAEKLKLKDQKTNKNETIKQKILRKATKKQWVYDDEGNLIKETDRKYLLESKNGRKYLANDTLFELKLDYTKLVGNYVSEDNAKIIIRDSSDIGNIKLVYQDQDGKRSVDGNTAFINLGEDHLFFQMHDKQKFYELLYHHKEEAITLKIYKLDELLSSKTFKMTSF